MYKVFINDSSIELQAEAKNDAESYKGKEQLQKLVKHLESPYQVQVVKVEHFELDQLWSDFRSLYTMVPAAGGIVKNQEGEILMIYRWEKWDLPKGKVEAGEKLDEAAVREVVEECGIPEPKILRKLPSTYHTYESKGKSILKETHWYEMAIDNKPALEPQREEDITKAEWVAPEIVRERLEDSYASLQWLFEQYA